MFPVSQQAYDRAITVFSPDGRLFQVEYAREAVKRGTTALGIVYKTGVLLGIDKNITSHLLKGESIEKIFQIDDHIAAATSGLVADARRLVDFARETCQQDKFVYSEAMDVEMLTRQVCDLKQAYTQFGGARPFGAALLIAGVDAKGHHLYETDPSGAMNEWSAAAIGGGRKEAEAVLDKGFSEDLKFEDAVELALRALMEVGDKRITKDTVDISFIDAKDKKYAVMSKDVLDSFIKRVLGKRGNGKPEKTEKK